MQVSGCTCSARCQALPAVIGISDSWASLSATSYQNQNYRLRARVRCEPSLIIFIARGGKEGFQMGFDSFVDVVR